METTVLSKQHTVLLEQLFFLTVFSENEQEAVKSELGLEHDHIDESHELFEAKKSLTKAIEKLSDAIDTLSKYSFKTYKKTTADHNENAVI